MVVRAEVLFGLETVTLWRQEAEVEVAEMRDVEFLLWEEGGWTESGVQQRNSTRYPIEGKRDSDVWTSPEDSHYSYRRMGLLCRRPGLWLEDRNLVGVRKDNTGDG